MNKLKINESVTLDNTDESDINFELEKAFLDYSISIVSSRAIPDIRDGLKPIHRRILYCMWKMKLLYNSPTKKSAKPVGEILAKYHPHSDTSVYDTIVRMAQYFNYREPLIFGQGNFGSIDGDSAAAMRYTEVKMSRFASEIVRDINYDTIDYQDNYDNSEKEPIILPSRVPHLLINGSTGIAVGMATSIPPHNIFEVIDALIYYLKNFDCSIDDLLTFVKGPDFPLGASILNNDELKNVYHTGRGPITIISTINEIKNKNDEIIQFIITDLPYQVNKSNVVIQIANLVESKEIIGISELRDESSRDGIRIVIDLKKGAHPYIIKNQLYIKTQLKINFNANFVAIVNGKPENNLNLKNFLQHYSEHQIEVIKRKYLFLLKKCKKRLEIISALIIAIDNIDDVIKIIKTSKNNQESYVKLTNKYGFNERQNKSILEMRLQKLTGLEKKSFYNEKKDLENNIIIYSKIISSKENIINEIINDLKEILNKYNGTRRTKIIDNFVGINEIDTIIKAECVLTFTRKGYIKLINNSKFRIQNRGGVGVIGNSLYSDDDIINVIFCSNIDNLLLFTNKGRVYRMPAYHIPEFSKSAKGVNINNLISYLKKYDEKIISIISVKDFDYEKLSLLFLTNKGIIKKISLLNFQRINKNGKLAINVAKHDDFICNIVLIDNNSRILISTHKGKVNCFNSSILKNRSRISYGVKGITLNKKIDYPVSLTSSIGNKKYLLAISENGYGKITHLDSFKIRKNRGGKGVLGMRLNKKTGNYIGSFCIDKTEDCLITTKKGMVIRINLSEKINVIGRATSGVKLIRLRANDMIKSLTLIAMDIDINVNNKSQNDEKN